MGHNFVSGLRTLKPKNPEKPKNLKKFSKNLGFSSPAHTTLLYAPPIR